MPPHYNHYLTWSHLPRFESSLLLTTDTFLPAREGWILTTVSLATPSNIPPHWSSFDTLNLPDISTTPFTVMLARIPCSPRSLFLDPIQKSLSTTSFAIFLRNVSLTDITLPALTPVAGAHYSVSSHISSTISPVTIHPLAKSLALSDYLAHLSASIYRHPQNNSLSHLSPPHPLPATFDPSTISPSNISALLRSDAAHSLLSFIRPIVILSGNASSYAPLIDNSPGPDNRTNRVILAISCSSDPPPPLVNLPIPTLFFSPPDFTPDNVVSQLLDLLPTSSLELLLFLSKLIQPQTQSQLLFKSWSPLS